MDPIGNPTLVTEIVNNARAHMYAANAGIDWLYDCNGCDPTRTILPGFPYVSPAADPAPWYDPNNPDSAGFYGVVGMDVTGEESSTRQASVNMGLTGIGVIGRTYMGPRTMVVRALLVAEDDCSLQYGMTWLRQQYASQHNPCGGDTMTFFDCCPCVCEDGGQNPDCWPDSYRTLRTGEDCTCPEPRGWWPNTYGQKKAGPPLGVDDPEWWPSIYLEDKNGPLPPSTQWWPDVYGQDKKGPPSPCGTDTWWAETYREESDGPPPGVLPWWPDTYQEEMVGDASMAWWYDTYGQERQGPPGDPNAGYWPRTYADLIAGPPPDDPLWCNWVDIYRELRDGVPTWSCCVEACVVPYLRQFQQVRVTEGPTLLNSPVLHSDGAVAEIEFTIVSADPKVYASIERAGGTWASGGGLAVTDARPPTKRDNPYRPGPAAPAFVPESWVREEFGIARVREQVLTGVEPRLRVRASRRSGPVRLGVWAGDIRVAGYTIPFVAENSSLVISGSDAYYLSSDGYERLSAFVKDWDGRWPRALDLPHGEYRVTIDQHPDDAVRLYVDAFVAPVGAG